MKARKESITLLTHEFYPKRGGIAVYTEEMALAAVNEGYAVDVWAPDSKHLKEAASTWPFSIQTINNKGTLNWPCRFKTAKAMRSIADKIKDTILYLPEPGPIITLMYGQLLNFPKPKKLILTLHGSEILRFSTFPHRKILFRKVLNQASKIGVVSEFNRSLLLKYHPSVADKTCVVSGALRSTFTPVEHQPNNDGRFKLITVGRIHPRKGQIHVIEALAQLPPELLSKITYQMAGPVVNQRYFEQLKQASEQQGIDVQCLGEVEDKQLTRYYQQADAFIMTSIQKGVSIEGFGLVYIEAASCGLPVIAHKTGGVGEAVRHNETGLLIEPGDTPALANAIQRLIKNPNLQHRLGQAGKQRIESLSWKENVKKLFP